MIKQFAVFKILDLIILYRRDSYLSIHSVTKYFSSSNKNFNIFVILALVGYSDDFNAHTPI